MKRWLALCLVVAAAVAFVAIPVWLIQPFAAQTERSLTVSYVLRGWSPLVTLVAFLLASALVVWLWRDARRWWRKALLVALLVPVAASAWFARQNYFEWMFRPLESSAYAKAGEASFLSDGDMVVAVELKGEAVAYPIRLMAYHHLVEDTVGGTPVVATY